MRTLLLIQRLMIKPKRLRMFAGPNGSGKSTLKDSLDPTWIGVYVNPDTIEQALRKTGCLHCRLNFPTFRSIA